MITGSNGLLGQHLVRLLSSDDAFDVLATSRGPNRLKAASRYQYQSLDIAQEAHVHQLMAIHKPDIIIHAAAMTHVDECQRHPEACWKANVEATRYLIRAAKEHECMFLLVSTDFIFDGNKGPYTEEALPNPVNFYGLSKLAAELLLYESGLSWAIARTVLVYGLAEDMSRSNIILWVKQSLEQGKRIRVVNDQWRTPTLVEDLAAGCMLIAEKGASGIFNISGGELLTPYDMAMQTAAYFHLDASLIEMADETTFQQEAKRPPRTGFDISKARSVLGYKPHSFQEGIAHMAKTISGVTS